ncbi:unnamed protein product, partial [Tetraodon nigroviridis]
WRTRSRRCRKGQSLCVCASMCVWPLALFYRTTGWSGLFSASQKTGDSCWRQMLITACQQRIL